MVILRWGEDLAWWAVEIQDNQWVDNTEWQLVIWNCNCCNDDDDDDNGNSNLKGSRQDKKAKTGNGNEPILPNQHFEDNDNPSENNDTKALELLSMCSLTELITNLVSPLSGILPMWSNSALRGQPNAHFEPCKARYCCS